MSDESERKLVNAVGQLKRFARRNVTANELARYFVNIVSQLKRFAGRNVTTNELERKICFVRRSGKGA